MINNPIHALTYRRKSSEEAKQEIFLMLSDFTREIIRKKFLRFKGFNANYDY